MLPMRQHSAEVNRILLTAGRGHRQPCSASAAQLKLGGHATSAQSCRREPTIDIDRPRLCVRPIGLLEASVEQCRKVLPRDVAPRVKIAQGNITDACRLNRPLACLTLRPKAPIGHLGVPNRTSVAQPTVEATGTLYL